MLKRTSLFLDESDMTKLKALALIKKTSMTGLIREGIALLYKSISSEEQKALSVLANLNNQPKKKGAGRGKNN
jgi:hypothetical protein